MKIKFFFTQKYKKNWLEPDFRDSPDLLNIGLRYGLHQIHHRCHLIRLLFLLLTSYAFEIYLTIQVCKANMDLHKTLLSFVLVILKEIFILAFYNFVYCNDPWPNILFLVTIRFVTLTHLGYKIDKPPEIWIKINFGRIIVIFVARACHLDSLEND